jgi:lipoprotein-anchoring transpeptidase ErfK/SrfK
MNPSTQNAQFALDQARKALQQGDAKAARRWASQATTLTPDKEEPWLYLAAVGSPHASVQYLERALAINPSSTRARQGMHWAVKRLRTTSQQPLRQRVYIPRSIPSRNLVHTRVGLPPANMYLMLFILLSVIFSGGWLASTSLIQSNASGFQDLNIIAQVNLGKATRTPTITPTFTPSPTPTETPTPTPTFTPTVTPIPTDTPTPEPTDTPEPYVEPEPEQINLPGLPAGVGDTDRWIDVNLSEQRVYAYEGYNQVESFTVSTGTWQYPTVTGTFNVYVMYRYADMSGPGYYLPNVPYVMYFYQGYGLHGTYWHNNFGTPMSHGCVNLRTEEAGWLFDFSYVGIVVNVHY